MKKIILINTNARIKIIPHNIMLQYKKKSKTKRIAWVTEGFFSDWTSMYEYYINSSPYRSNEDIGSFKKLIEVVQRSTDEISRILINNKLKD
jgi:hypothetical protein